MISGKADFSMAVKDSVHDVYQQGGNVLLNAVTGKPVWVYRNEKLDQMLSVQELLDRIPVSCTELQKSVVFQNVYSVQRSFQKFTIFTGKTDAPNGRSIHRPQFAKSCIYSAR